MSGINTELLEKSALAIVFLVFINGLFSLLRLYLEKKKAGSKSHEEELLTELKLINSNHLNSIEKAINCGNDKLTNAVNDGNQKIIEILSRIDGRLK